MSSDARRALLSRLIDHAALFPPASMSMCDAVAEDQRVRAGEEAWLVSRFVCPLSKLGELGDAQLPLSVVLDADGPVPNDARIEAVESRPRDGLAGTAPEVYVELAPGDERLSELPALGFRAKVRCGGATVPSVEELAGFVRDCRELDLPFKATAGLHHPVRSDGAHGFLNLLAAAVFGDEEAALAEEEVEAFRVTADAFLWRDRSASPDEIARVRREVFVGFGSCSVAEPVEDLRALGIL